MGAMKRLVCILVLGLASMLYTHAQPDGSNLRWSIDGGINSSIQTISSNDYPGNIKQAGLGWSFHAEYYLPDLPISVKAGYDREELALGGGDVSAQLNQFSLGGRWYILPAHYIVQPFAGADAYFHIGSREEQGSVTSWGYRKGEWVKHYETAYSVRIPRFCFAPVVGVDVYLLSCVALQLAYGYHVGVDSRFEVNTKNCQTDRIYTTRTKGNRHTLSMGLKLTFPFSFSDSDTSSLIDWILGL